MPLLSQLSANGNYTIAGTFDEATFNRNSGYKKNLLSHSQNFTETSSWPNNNLTILNTNELAPDGSFTATKFTYRLQFALVQSVLIPIIGGKTYTFSVYAKSTTQFIALNNSVGHIFMNYDLKNGTLGGNPGGSSTNRTSNITLANNGFYRCSVTFTIPVDFSGTTRWGIWLGGFNGDNWLTETMTLWGAQLEEGPVLTPYEVTDGSGLPISNTASRLDSTGNFYTAGQIDEVTYNKTNPVFKNLLTYTESFNAAVWGPNLGIVVPNAILAPDGKSYAIKLVERIDGSTITSNQRIISNKIAVDANTIYTFSIYLKSGGRDYARIYFEDSRATGGDGGGRVGALLNLASGTITSSYLTGSNALLGSNLQKLDNGWFRFSWTVKTLLSSPVNGTSYIIFGMGNTPTSFAYIGDGVSGMYFWGIQMEKGSQVTTYQGVDAPGVLINSNTTTRLESTGNHYLAGAAPTYDEVTGILPVTDSLVTYLDPVLLQSYPGSGTTWYDLSGNNHHGTLNGSRTPIVHPLGYLGLNAQQALNGQQSTQRLGQSVSFNNNPALYFEGRKPWTIVIWFKLTADPGPNSYARIFDRDLNPDGSGRRGFNLYAVQTGGTNINISSERWAPKQTSASVGFTVPTSSFLNTWNNVTVTYDGTTLTMYRNGVSVSTAASTGEAEIVQGQYTIFLYAANNGYVGQNLIYSRALTATEVLATYNATKLRYVY